MSHMIYTNITTSGHIAFENIEETAHQLSYPYVTDDNRPMFLDDGNGSLLVYCNIDKEYIKNGNTVMNGGRFDADELKTIAHHLTSGKMVIYQSSEDELETPSIFVLEPGSVKELDMDEMLNFLVAQGTSGVDAINNAMAPEEQAPANTVQPQNNIAPS